MSNVVIYAPQTYPSGEDGGKLKMLENKGFSDAISLLTAFANVCIPIVIIEDNTPKLRVSWNEFPSLARNNRKWRHEQ